MNDEFVGDNKKNKPEHTSKRKGDLLKRRETIKKLYKKYITARSIKVEKQDHALIDYYDLYVFHKDGGLTNFTYLEYSFINHFKNILANQVKDDSWPYPFIRIQFNKKYGNYGTLLFEKPVCIEALAYLRKFLKEHPPLNKSKV